MTKAKSLLNRKPLNEALPEAPKQEGHLRQRQIRRVAPQDLLCHGRGLSRNKDTPGLEKTTAGAAWKIVELCLQQLPPRPGKQSARVKGEGSTPRCRGKFSDGQAARMQDISWSVLKKQEWYSSRRRPDARTDRHRHRDQDHLQEGFAGAEALTGQVLNATLSLESSLDPLSRKRTGQTDSSQGQADADELH